jgi:hypothetical protein
LIAYSVLSARQKTVCGDEPIIPGRQMENVRTPEARTMFAAFGTLELCVFGNVAA